MILIASTGIAWAAMVLGALLISQNSSCETARMFVYACMYICMSYHYIKYEFLGPDSAGFRGGEVQFQVSEFFEPLEM